MSNEQYPNLLPMANVGRIMKQILPHHAKVSKEAKERMQECASEFISFVTGEASDKCRRENRKTMNGDDICWALSALGFDNYSEAVSKYLHRYREQESRQRRTTYHGKNQQGLGSEEEDQDEQLANQRMLINTGLASKLEHSAKPDT